MRILFRNSPAFTFAFINSRYNIIFICNAVYIHSKSLKKGSFGKSICRWSKTSLKYCFFFVSTLNSMDGVLCSVIVSEQLKIRKSLAINYWQDTISGFAVNSNVGNVNNLWGISTSFEFCAIFYFNTIFSIHEKHKLAKIWKWRGKGAAAPKSPAKPSPLFSRFLRACDIIKESFV